MIRPDVRWAFARYRAIDHHLPRAEGFPKAPEILPDLGAIVERYEGFILDAFGVLNVGGTVIATAVERIAQIRAAGKRLVVLTNGASQPREVALAKYHRWGFDFTADEVIASRDLAAAHLAAHPLTQGGVWAAIGPKGAPLADLPGDVRAIDDDLLRAADGFLFLGSEGWTEARQAALVAALQERPRPVICANPDVIAPRETGFTWEPGHYAADLPAPVTFFGKPFGGALQAALTRLDLPAARAVMVGDSLHTDILGGRAAGCGTALVAGHGFFAGHDPMPFIRATGLVPDVIASVT
ncbi:HAD-IIA family hydrolase [Pararhodobacter oceanensis]|uniref:HAD-IIA family hydrolase n=1 Tax=Pararhodobacter oceanensis TaxID=2172121 RepID=UPI003A8DB927